MSTVVFLDIDGPIQSMRSSLGGFKADPVAVKVINGWLSRPDVLTVLSSTVRILCKTPEQAKEVLQRKYGLEGMTFHSDFRTGDSQVADQEPDNGREKEIRAWLAINQSAQDVYYAVEDDDLKIPNVIHIQATENGLSNAQIAKILQLSGRGAADLYDSWNNYEAKRRSQAKPKSANYI